MDVALGHHGDQVAGVRLVADVPVDAQLDNFRSVRAWPAFCSYTCMQQIGASS